MNNPLAAIPLIPDTVAARADDQARLQLCRAVPYKPTLGGRLAARLRLDRAVRLDLDDRGSRFWRLIDGQRTLDDIANELCAHRADQLPEMRRAVLLYTKELMTRRFICLRVPTSPVAADPS